MHSKPRHKAAAAMTDLPFHTPLTPAQQQAAGLERTWPLALADQVRFSEIDALNHVNNVAYLVWFETLRVKYFKHIGLTTYTSPATEPRIVIRRGEIDWLAEMRAEEVYVTTARTTGWRTTSFTLAQEIRAGGTLRATLSSVVVLLDPGGAHKMPIPSHILELFRAGRG